MLFWNYILEFSSLQYYFNKVSHGLTYYPLRIAFLVIIVGWWVAETQWDVRACQSSVGLMKIVSIYMRIKWQCWFSFLCLDILHYGHLCGGERTTNKALLQCEKLGLFSEKDHLGSLSTEERVSEYLLSTGC